jgi:hypothetical protein
MLASHSRIRRLSNSISRYFVVAFLFFLTIDFVSVFVAFGVADTFWQLFVHAGGVNFNLSAPGQHDWGSRLVMRPWFPNWNPTHFVFGDRTPGYLIVAFPLWILSLPCMLAAFVFFRPSVPRADTCAHCGYDLRALPTSVCPECGKPITQAGAKVKARPSIRAFLSKYKMSVRFSISLIGIGWLLIFGMRVFIWMGEKETTLIIPTGYVGSIVFVEDENGVAPEGGWGKYRYRIPESGVLRVTDIDAVKNYLGTPSRRIKFICQEEDGSTIDSEGPFGLESKCMHLSGPFGRPGITIAKIGFGPMLRPHDLSIRAEEQQRLQTQGVPADYIAPHKIFKKGEIPREFFAPP